MGDKKCPNCGLSTIPTSLLTEGLTDYTEIFGAPFGSVAPFRALRTPVPVACPEGCRGAARQRFRAAIQTAH